MIRNKNAYLKWQDNQPAPGIAPGPSYERIEVPCYVCEQPTPVTVAPGAEPQRARCANCAIHGKETSQ